MEPLLAVEHISKTYGDSRVLQDVAFDLYQGCLLYTSRRCFTAALTGVQAAVLR